MIIELLNSNKRSVIVEKFVEPKWFKNMFSKKPQLLLLQNNSMIETYKIFLRVLSGDDVTITGGCEAEINKWGENPRKINIHLAAFFIEGIFIIGEDSGNFETNEVHYNIYASRNYNNKNILS